MASRTYVYKVIGCPYVVKPWHGNQISYSAKGITSIKYNHLITPSNSPLSGSRINDFTYVAETNPERSKGQVIAVNAGATGFSGMNMLFSSDVDVYEKIGALVLHGFGHNGGYLHGTKRIENIMSSGNELMNMSFNLSSGATQTIKQICSKGCDDPEMKYITNRLWKIQ